MHSILLSAFEQQRGFRGTAVEQLSSCKLLTLFKVEIPSFSEVSWKSSFVVLRFNQLFALRETLNTSFQKASGDVCRSSVSSSRNNDF